MSGERTESLASKSKLEPDTLLAPSPTRSASAWPLALAALADAVSEARSLAIGAEAGRVAAVSSGVALLTAKLEPPLDGACMCVRFENGPHVLQPSAAGQCAPHP
jgi:hypothetical protein